MTRRGFTIIELLIVVIIIGILAAAGLAKYQNFAETGRRKTCLSQLNSIEAAFGVWEMNNQAFGENAKCAWGFTPRTGRLTDTAILPAILAVGTAGNVVGIGDTQSTVGGAQPFFNSAGSGPLGSVIRDDNIWICPAALSRYYGGEIQNVPDDYMDTTGGGYTQPHGGTPIGMGGRYLSIVAGKGNGSLPVAITNGGFPAGWITGAATATNVITLSPSPQVPFKIVICGSFGTFGPSAGAAFTGTTATNQGGPVGPDGSTLSRHSDRW